jgi:ribosomal protein S18 acetylase RimI-like enzyme
MKTDTRGDLQFRSAKPADIPQLTDLALVSYGTLAAVMSETESDKLRAGLSRKEMWEQLVACSHGFLCESGTRLTGMAFLVPSGNPWDVFPADWSYIRLVGVDPLFQGLGIARALTERCVEKARDLGESVIGLHTSEMMPAARHIYETMGFRVIREIERRYGLRYWLYAMEL